MTPPRSSGASKEQPRGNTPRRAIRLSDDDWATWKLAADQLGLDVSSMLRMLVKRELNRQKRANK